MKPSPFGFSSHTPKAPASSSVQTLMALQNGLKTHEEFQFNSQRISLGFRNQAQILAYYLISLWMPKTTQLKQNYLGLIRDKKLFFKGNLKKIEDIPATQMRNNLSQSHLGALTFLNLLFSGQHHHNHLSLLETNDGSCLFTQNLQTFWIDYFYPEKTNLNLFSQHSLEEKLQFFFSKNPTWWQELTHGLSIRKIFLDEIFQIYLRIYITPFSLIEKIAYRIIDEQYQPELKKFLKYLEPKLDLVINRFENFLSFEEKVAWSEFQLEQSHQEFLNYYEDLDIFFQNYRLLSQSEQTDEKHLVLAYALNLGIPDMLGFLQAEQVSRYNPVVQEFCFIYIYDLVRSDWDEMRKDPQHVLWSIFNNFCSGITNYNSHIQINANNDITYLLAKAIVFQFNYLARFLLVQNPLLVRMTNIFFHFDDLKDEKIKNKSIYFIALIAQNKDIIQSIKPYHPSLKTDEIEELQNVIWHCIRENHQDKFQFILTHAGEVLGHIQRDMTSFRSQLETHCLANAPEFFALIPKPTANRIHFLSRIHIGFYSSSSDSEDNERADYGSTLCTKV